MENNDIVDPNRDAFLKAVMNARSLQGVETAMDHYDRLMDRIHQLEHSVDYWRKLAKKLEGQNQGYKLALQDIDHGPVGYWNDPEHHAEVIKHLMKIAHNVLYENSLEVTHG